MANERHPALVVALALQNPGKAVPLRSPLEEMAAVGWALTVNLPHVHGATSNGERAFVAWESEEQRDRQLSEGP